MSQNPERGSRNTYSDPFDYINLGQCNPWWDGPSGIPRKSLARTDLYWRVRNALEYELLLIPGPQITGTTATLKQLIRALIRGKNHDNERIASLFSGDSSAASAGDSYDANQICYASCSDPIAPVVDDFIDQVRKAHHERAAQTGELAYFLIFDDVHRLDDWQKQLQQTHGELREAVPHEDWTIVATVPFADIAHDTELTESDSVNTDRPHLSQKFRDTLVADTPSLRREIRSNTESNPSLENIRDVFEAAAVGEADPDQVSDAFRALADHVTQRYEREQLSSRLNRYLTYGGFEPAIISTSTHESENELTVSACRHHIEQGLTETLYREVPRLATVEPDFPRIESPEELHAFITFLARRPFTETTYPNVADDFLDCDARTLRQKYVPLLETLHIGERATRYNLQRNRSLRFYLRSPGYITGLTGAGVTEESRIDRLRMTLSDHLRRLLPKLDSTSNLQYWRNENHLIDFVFDIEGTPVPFVSEFNNDDRSTTDAFASFSRSSKVEQSQSLEVVVETGDSDIMTRESPTGHMQLVLPHWLLLMIC